VARFLFFLVLFCSTALPAQIDTVLICQPGQEVQLNAPPGRFAYEWSPATGLRNPTIANPTVRPVATTLYVARMIGAATGPNLVQNPGFTDGNVGFTSDYPFVTAINTQGRYGINTSAANLNGVFFTDCPDHTSGSGMMMIVDGSPVANERVWCQTIAVTLNQEYALSAWLTSVNPSNAAQLQFSISNNRTGRIFTASNEVCDWRQFYATWNAGAATEAEICIVNKNTNPTGNDFALDDFAFFELQEVLLDSTLVLLPEISHEITLLRKADCGERNGMIIVSTTTNGPTSFTYSLDGGPFLPEGSFGDLAPGDYGVTIRNEAVGLTEEPCLEELFISVPQRDCPVYLPTAFSPNSDGINDQFQLFASTEFTGTVRSLRVYDRWGGLVFEAADAATALAGWDGRVNGIAAAAGTYVYLLEIEGNEGTLIEQRGAVVLLR
jgi:gliding motility-associated-like protein